jgi:hypothetical protein
MAAATCPWCDTPRVAEPSCPRCGANYAKAEQIKVQGRAAAAQQTRISEIVHTGDSLAGLPEVEDRELEWWFAVAAIPAALLLGVLFHLMLPGMQRIFLGMPVHEFGHAASAWFCGHWAIPTLWKTPMAEARGVVMPVLLLAGLGWCAWKAWTTQQPLLAGLAAFLVLVQAYCTLVIKPMTALSLIVWGGDGTGMILAAALMASFFFGRGTQLYRGSLRWGFLAIGAGAFADMFGTWWAARADFGKIPFGEMEGVGLSDATRLVDEFNWTTEGMIRRYVLTGVACLVALALVYAWGVHRAWREKQKA